MSKKLFIILSLLVTVSGFCQKSGDTTISSRTGWLIYWREHKFWIDAKLSKAVKPKDFFKGAVYKNSLRIPSHYKANFLGMFASPYVISYRPSTKNHAAFQRDSIWILPVIAEIKRRPAQPDEFESLIFYYKRVKVEISYHFEDNYIIENFEPLRRKEQIKLNRFLKRKGWTLEDAIKQQKGAF